MHKFVAFIMWIFSKMIQGLVERNQNIRYNLRREPGLTIFVWAIVTFFGTILTVGVTALFTTQSQVAMAVGTTTLIASAVYFVYTSISCMYQSFKKERAELFETIKHS